MLDGVPHQSMVHEVVAVDEDISERDDLRVRADPGSCFGVGRSEPLYGLADDLEVAFNGLAQQAAGALLG